MDYTRTMIFDFQLPFHYPGKKRSYFSLSLILYSSPQILYLFLNSCKLHWIRKNNSSFPSLYGISAIKRWQIWKVYPLADPKMKVPRLSWSTELISVKHHLHDKKQSNREDNNNKWFAPVVIYLWSILRRWRYLCVWNLKLVFPIQ